MDAGNVDIIGANTATTGISRNSRVESAVSAALIAGLVLARTEFSLRDFGWLCREIRTGFPALKFKVKDEIRRGWQMHEYSYKDL